MFTNCKIEKKNDNYFVVIGDSKRFGKGEILFEGINRKECEAFCKREKCEMANRREVFHKPTSVKRKLDALQKRMKKEDITVDCGVCNYAFDHYEFTKSGFRDGKFWDDEIDIYVIDFWTNKPILLFTLTEENMRKPRGEEDLFREFNFVHYDTKYPSLFCISNFEYRR